MSAEQWAACLHQLLCQSYGREPEQVITAWHLDRTYTTARRTWVRCPDGRYRSFEPCQPEPVYLALV